jgi:dipeptide/tripeptide permease
MRNENEVEIELNEAEGTSTPSSSSSESLSSSSRVLQIRFREPEYEKQDEGGRIRSCNSSSMGEEGSCIRFLRRWSPFPPIVWLIIVSEFTERFSFYSLRAILTLYMTTDLHLSEPTAIALYNFSLFLIYSLPVLGAWISDSHWGKFRVIFYFSLIYVAGGCILSFTTRPPMLWGCVLGLVLIAVGSGGIKPCVSSFGAEQFESPLASSSSFSSTTTTTSTTTSSPSLSSSSPSSTPIDEEAKKLARYFATFFTVINAGSLFSFIISPIIRSSFGYFYAFGLPTLLLAIATIVILSGKPCYHIKLPKKGENIAFAPIKILLLIPFLWLKHSFRRAFWKSSPTLYQPQEDDLNLQVEGQGQGQGQKEGQEQVQMEGQREKSLRWIEIAAEGNLESKERGVEHTRAILRIASIFAFVPMFFCLADQQGSTWTIQAEKMDLRLFPSSLSPDPFRVEPEQLGVINPLFLVFFVPVVNYGLYPLVEKVIGIKVTELKRIGLGLALVTLGFIPPLFLEMAINNSPPQSVNVWWQFPQLLISTVAEVFLGPTLLGSQTSHSLSLSLTSISSHPILLFCFKNLLFLSLPKS